MTKKNATTPSFVFISILLHLSLLLMFAINQSLHPKPVYIGENIPIINSYISKSQAGSFTKQTENDKPKAKAQQDKVGIAIKKELHKKVIPQKKKPLPVSNHKVTSINTRQSSISKGIQTSELLSLLHADIQRQQQYPVSAEEMGREGRVTVKFLLLANGEARQVEIEKSSGTTSLDNAAIAAVQNASPFKDVQKYLHDAQQYTVDVVFQL